MLKAFALVAPRLLSVIAPKTLLLADIPKFDVTPVLGKEVIVSKPNCFQPPAKEAAAKLAERLKLLFRENDGLEGVKNVPAKTRLPAGDNGILDASSTSRAEGTPENVTVVA